MVSELLNRLNQWFEKLPDRVRQRRKMVWSLFVALTLLIASGGSFVRIDMTLDAFFQDDDPTKIEMNRFRSLFGSDEVAYVIYKTKDGDIFSEKSLQLVYEIQQELQNYRLLLSTSEASPLDHITDVKTILNASYMEAGENSLISRNFIGDNIPKTTEEREKIRKAALAHPEYPLLYISENTEYGAILIRTDFGTKIKGEALSVTADSDFEEKNLKTVDDSEIFGFEELNEDADFDVGSDSVDVIELGQTEGLPEYETPGMPDYAEFMRVLNAKLEQPQYREHLKFYPVGNPPMMAFFNDVIVEEIGTVSALSILLIAIVLWILFRSFSAVIWPLVIIVVSLLWVVGLIGWSGMTMTMMLNIIIFLVLAIGVADTVHILSGYLFFRNRGENHEQALRSVFRKTALACLLTSITTMIGMFSLLLVPIEPIQSFGLFAGFGVFIAFLLSVFVLPVMLDLWSPFATNPKKNNQRLDDDGQRLHFVQYILRKVEPLSYRYPLIVTLSFVSVAVILGYGMSKVKIDTNMVNIIKDGLPMRSAYNIVDNFMGGAGSAQILVNTGKIDGLKDPRVLQAMEDLQIFMKKEYPHLVTKSTSLVSISKDSFKALNEGQDSMYVIPEDPGILANTLFMFNNANPKERRRMVTDDYALGRISVNLRNSGSEEYNEMINKIHVFADQRFAELKNDYPQIQVRVTGTLAMLSQMTDYISWSQVRSFGLALIVISLLLLLVFSSYRAGMVALLPNIFPVLTIFGIMGYLDISLDTDTLLVAPITIGIAVDDTIHFLTHYRTEVSKHGNIKEGIIKAFRETGQAIAFTSIILSIGFLIFLMSSHQGLSNFGIMSAIAFFSALFADLFLLPSMCMLFKVRFKQKGAV
ncbi:MAG: MMPL family transporter [SAR324 cluster bacterium]|nr:MMPL family transporter [SAR324 cluster bacterium]MBL7035409.1 MMPL family transporter [SAR324 cluster bacterium]